MRFPRRAVAALLAFGLLGVAVPAVTLAAGGGSAGDQQYTDPFGGSNSGSTIKRVTTTTSAPTTPSAPPTTASAPPTTAATPPTTTPSTVAAATTASDPTATAAAGTNAKSLPYTGYDGELAALLGGGLVLGGAALRIRFRRS